MVSVWGIGVRVRLWTLPARYAEQGLHDGPVSVRRLSVRLSRRSTAAAACGRFAAERGRGPIDGCGRHVTAIDRYLRAPALSSKRGQRYVESRGTRLNTDLLNG